MAISFPRSIRALGSDRFRPSLVTLGITSLLLVAWFAWFFFAPISQYAAGTGVSLGRNGTVTASFSADLYPLVHVGQTALLQLSVPGQSPAAFRGQVLRVPRSGTAAELYFPDLARVPVNAKGTVQVETTASTPAALVLRALRESTVSLHSPPAPPPTPTALP